VQRQYTGSVGTENCQVGVFLTYVGPQGHAFLDRRLYLPQGWADDPECRAEAAAAETVSFQTKPELAWAMLEHAGAMGMPGRWVTGDTVYGQDPPCEPAWTRSRLATTTCWPSRRQRWCGSSSRRPQPRTAPCASRTAGRRRLLSAWRRPCRPTRGGGSR
jgi:SRSO17 transposase